MDSQEFADALLECECDAPVYLRGNSWQDPESVRLVYECDGCGKRVAVYATVNVISNITEVEAPREPLVKD